MNVGWKLKIEDIGPLAVCIGRVGSMVELDTRRRAVLDANETCYGYGEGGCMMERYLKYVAICERAEKMEIGQGDRFTTMMDIESADKRFNLRLEELLEAEDFDFAHDVCGISKNIIRDDFPATDFGFFVPRFAGRVV